MSDKIHLEIVTPAGRALSVEVDEVTAPSVEGEFGVLPGHLPLLAALRTGIVTYRRESEAKQCAVGTGFAEAGPDKLILLTSEFTERAQIDPVLVRKELAEVEQKLARLEGVAIVAAGAKGAEAPALEARAERNALIARENWLAVQLELYGDPPPATQRPYEEFGPPSPVLDDDASPDGNVAARESE
ncbi:MAG: ATP synthase F1 subunit epsilon [Polyangiaceae bacterium]|jgi:F-type H+-transporting ATPase subunit epsilon